MIKFFMRKILMIGLSILFFSFFSILFLLFRNNREINGDLKIKGNSFIEGLKILHKKNGIDAWTLNAKRADFIEDENKAELSNISMVIQKNGIVLYADKGVYNLSEQSFTTDGIVQAEAKDYIITADSIDYEASSGKIKTDGRIRVEGKRFKVEGKGMRADAGQKVSISNDVKAIFYR